ncbi:MAG: 4Fe-4S dicluster domain-containing protein [Bacteroidales bacterium]|nr:4Fe-4S dicluster domain-containing protein [Bacteroidales bacterium]
MLKKLRTILGTIFLVCITALFLDFTGTLKMWLSWMADLQFLPAVLGLNLVAIVIVLALTLLFGRIYCSVICPAGTYQDAVSHLAAKFKKNRFSFSKENKILRFSVLGVFVILLLVGLNGIAILIAPYSAYGRMVENLLGPIYKGVNNLLAQAAEHYDSYAFYEVDVWIKAMPVFIVAVVTAIVFTVLSWHGGRTWCNNICPVGTVLGYLSKFSLFKIRIDADKCVNCRLCEKNCKSSCIDIDNHTVDYSRCVSCMNCLGKCKKDAIHFALAPKSQSAPAPKNDGKPDASLRAMLTATATLAATSVLHAQDKTTDGGLAVIEDKKIPERETPVKPAGSRSLSSFSSKCTGCQLCVAVCPNGVLRPSTKLATFMQPEMSFERGYCRPECTRCGEVCPAGAIQPITREQKTAIRAGHAVWVKDNCLPQKDGVPCGNCAEHCPSGAITMVPKPDNPQVKIPSIDTERCLGCGACEHLCPVRPFSAIYVEGNLVHGDM